MYKPIEGRFYNWTGFVFMVVMIILFNLIFTVVATAISGLICHVSWREVLSAVRSPDGTAQTINITRWFTIIATLGYLLIPALLFARINNTSLVKIGHLNRKPRPGILLLCLFIIIISIPATGFIEQLTHHIPFPSFLKYYAENSEFARSKTFDTLLDMQAFSELFVGIGIAALMPALLEEIMFRGIIQNIGKGIFKNHFWKVILFQGAVFALMHFTIYQFFAIMAMGVIFGIVFYYTQNLWYTIVMHFTFNSLAVIAKYINIQFFNKNGYNLGIENTPTPWYIGLMSIVLMVVLVRAVIQKSKSEQDISLNSANFSIINENNERMD